MEELKHRDRTELTPRETEMLELQKRGLTYDQISQELGISIGTIKAHILSANLRLRAKEHRENAITIKQAEALQMQEEGLTYQQISDVLGISEQAVSDRLARARRHLNGTKAPKRSQAGKKLFPREQELLDLKRQGLSHVQIAERMGISERTVKNYMNNIRKKGVIVGRRINRRIQNEN